jgi:unsaturated chondroitin disaccharide hydrolase
VRRWERSCYGAALGEILCGDTEAAELALAGARGLASAYTPAARLIPLGTSAEEVSDVGNGETNIDGVPGGALLVWAAERTGDERLRRIAAAHAERHIHLCVREDGSVVQSASFDPASAECCAATPIKDSPTFRISRHSSFFPYSN